MMRRSSKALDAHKQNDLRGSAVSGTQLVEFRHQTRLPAGGVVRMDDALARDSIKHADRVLDGGGRGGFITFGDLVDGTPDRTTSRGAIRLVPLSTPLRYTKSLFC